MRRRCQEQKRNLAASGIGASMPRVREGVRLHFCWMALRLIWRLATIALPGALDTGRCRNLRVSGLAEDPRRGRETRRAEPSQDVPCREHGRLLRPGKRLSEKIVVCH